MSDKEYFAHPGISNSKLGLLKKGCLVFQAGFTETSSSMDLGSLVHKHLLEPDTLTISNVKRPSDSIIKLCKDVKKRKGTIAQSIEENYSKYFKSTLNIRDVLSKGLAYYKTLNDDDFVVNPTMLKTLHECVNAINRNLTAYKLLFPDKDPSNYFNDIKVYNETAIFDEYRVSIYASQYNTVISRKCKIDNYWIDSVNKVIYLNDIKTTSSTIADFCKESFVKYDYSRQLAYYKDMLVKHLMNTKGLDLSWKVEVHLIVVTTTAPFDCRVIKLSKETLNNGKSEFEYLLKEYAKYEANGFKDPELITI